jgi:salicylate hydroxylase
MRLRDKDNVSIADVPFDTRKTVGAPSVLVKRSEIAAEIRRLATDPERSGTPARIINNARVVNVDIIRTSLVTDDGRTFTGDILVGADGINSVIRSAMLASTSTLGGEQKLSEGPKGGSRPSGLVAYVTSVPREVIASDTDLAFQADVESAAGLTTYYGSAGRGAKERVLVYPINKTQFQVVGYSPEEPWVADFETSRSSILKNRASSRIAEDFKEFHPSVRKLFRYALP